MSKVPTIGEVVRRWREEDSKLTVTEFAKHAGMTKGYVSAVERNVIKNPTEENLEKLARAIGITPMELHARKMPPEDVGIGYPALPMAATSGAGVGLGAIKTRSSKNQQEVETVDLLSKQNIGFLVEQIVDETQLTPENRTLVEALVLESVRSICRVLAKNQ